MFILDLFRGVKLVYSLYSPLNTVGYPYSFAPFKTAQTFATLSVKWELTVSFVKKRICVFVVIFGKLLKCFDSVIVEDFFKPMMSIC